MTAGNSTSHGNAGGFTILELTVVAGLLAIFLMFLMQLLSEGISVFDEGEQGQELADLSAVAAEGTREALASMVGPRRDDFQSGAPDARLLVQWVPLGLPGSDDSSQDMVQAIRATVAVPPVLEDQLRAAELRDRASQEGAAAQDIEGRVAELQSEVPRHGRATMLLVPWPAGDPDGAFLELRRGLWLPGQNIELDRRRQVPLFAIEDVARLPAELVVADTEPLVAGLLHVEFSFWSQYTRSFDSRSPEDGPEWVWDSARAGLLTAGDDPRRQFSLDLGPESLDDTTDDVFPRMVRATLVVARHGRVARLAASLAPSATELQLLTTRPLPDLETTEYLKVGGEWVRHGGVRGNVLRGLTRGVRGTVARAHARGTAVRAGKKIVVLVPVLYGRDSWNG